jgi:outer membrane lipoprotein
MRYRNRDRFACTIAIAILLPVILTGCSTGPQVIPGDLEGQIDKSVSFPQLLSDADMYRGRTVLLGGEILSAKRLQEGTQFEILQLPTDGDNPPALRRNESQGRFLALDHSGLDPAAYSAGTRITVVGEVTGQAVQRLDESDYRYPTVTVKHLYVWDPREYERRWRTRPTVGLFGGMGFGFGGGGGGSFGGLGIGTGF